MRLFTLTLAAAGVLLPLSGATALHCGKLLDVRTGKWTANSVIVVDGRNIVAADPAAAIPNGSMDIDLSKGACLPGLIDVHDHLTSDPRYAGYEALSVSVPRSTVTGVKNARTTLQAGFTTVRNVGAAGYSDVALRDGINDGDIEGPRMFVSGPPLGITGGHCDNNLLAPEFNFRESGVADGPWAARAKVREVVKYGADLIKVCASGGVLSKGDQPGTPQYTLEEMQAIADEAHKLGRKVAAHAHGTQSIKDAIRAGIDSIEHSSLIDDEGIALAKQHGTFLVFDIYIDDYILTEGAKVGMLAESLEKEVQIGKLQRQNFRKAYLAGARIAFGTDAGGYPHGDNAKQFAVMVEWGMKPIEAIRAATTEAAALLGIEARAGTLEPHHSADVIAVEGDPLEDVRALTRVKFVMKEGKVYRNDWAETNHHRD
ncbi:MAG TPA: amidohydrolase family protein [Bryobacteraceae bacterium]|nr:amidohydrolase family protein [Bryobacteraceae bacterium]